MVKDTAASAWAVIARKARRHASAGYRLRRRDAPRVSGAMRPGFRLRLNPGYWDFWRAAALVCA
ncbi:MAG: hypothetical protein COW59_08580, partial [Lysobacterales bacterium CG17_big_fil_post_rev_8_21_14_2_50_64_11]